MDPHDRIAANHALWQGWTALHVPSTRHCTLMSESVGAWASVSSGTSPTATGSV